MNEQQTISNLRQVLDSMRIRIEDLRRNAMDPGVDSELSEMSEIMGSTVKTVDKNYPVLPHPD
jgi:hypothetical protein